jgi:lipid II:glycine glycyltransferase (peptidoglycan interpeptide bridge formation enzyme)
MRVIKKNINIISDEEKSEIDSLIIKERGLIFHETKLNEIISESYNTEFFYFLAYNSKGELKGICPLHSIKRGIINENYSNPSSFKMPFGGWVFDPDEFSIKELWARTKLKINESLHYWSNLQIHKDEYRNLMQEASIYQSPIVDLAVPEEIIWESQIHKTNKYKIRKAQRNKVEVKSYGVEGFELYEPMMKEMEIKAGLDPGPKSFYNKILEAYFPKKQAVVLLAEKEGEVISGVFLLGNKNVTHYWMGAMKHPYQNLGQTKLVQWEAIKWSKKNGCKFYDLCVIESDKLPNIAEFKLSFSKKTVPFYYISKRPFSFRLLVKFQKLFLNKH